MAHDVAADFVEPDAGRCLNCGEPLHGAFCAGCGQRSVPADPTVREVAGDAWHELSGYDGRIAATFRALLRPGFLTLEYLQGRRARYLSPVRLYLFVSVIYFLLAAAAPETAGGLRVAVVQADGAPTLSEQDRAEALRELETSSSWLLRMFLRRIVEDPEGFRSSIFTVMPRVFFAMLPLFAAAVGVFYRNRRFPTALVFAVHLHTFAFVVFAASQLAKFSGSATFAGVIGLVASVILAVYALKAFKRVFGGNWPTTFAKAIAIGIFYVMISVPAFIIMLVWASLL